MVATAQYSRQRPHRTACRSRRRCLRGRTAPGSARPLLQRYRRATPPLPPLSAAAGRPGLICRLWERHYGRLPDFVILEGPGAGGHLGFSQEELASTPVPCPELLQEVLAALAPYPRKAPDRDIPVFVAGGIRDGARDAPLYASRRCRCPVCHPLYRHSRSATPAPGYKRAAAPRPKPGDISHRPKPSGYARAGRCAAPSSGGWRHGTQPPAGVGASGCITACDAQQRALLHLPGADCRLARRLGKRPFFLRCQRRGIKRSLTTVREEMEQIMKEWRDAP